MSDLPTRKRLRDYATGNAVPGGPSSVEGVSEEMARRFEAMAAAMPPQLQARLQVISGYRDAARQAQVNPGVKHSRHGSGTGGPGTGMALDLGNDPEVLNWIDQYGRQHGLGFPLKHMANEQNHLEMIDPDTGGRVAIGSQYAGNPGAGVKTGMRRLGVAEANLPAPAPDLALSPDLAAEVRPSAAAPRENLAALLQVQREDPFARIASNSLSGALTAGLQPAPVQPQPILQPTGPTIFGGPLPLARKLV